MARETVTIEGLDQVVERLKALGAIAQRAGGPVAKAVRRGGRIVLDEAKKNLQRVIDEPNVAGDNVSTGLMVKSLKLNRNKRNKKYKGETYTIKAPGRARYPVSTRNPQGDAVQKIANILEYGSPKMQPHPWMRPAFHSKKEAAAREMGKAILEEIDKLERKLARG